MIHDIVHIFSYYDLFYGFLFIISEFDILDIIFSKI